jgi:ribonuclease HII
MEELLLGIDDAGRGPVIGPMILAGVLIDDETRKNLRSLGVNDSKKLTQKRRELLEKEIISQAKGYFVIATYPDEIEKQNKEGVKLNEVEAIQAAKIIDELNKSKTRIKVFIDCPSTSLIKWAEYLKTKVTTLSNLEISCEHKADANHVCVSAASILAKCEREREMDKLREEYGSEIGSGYTSDPLTRKFLEKFAVKYKDKGIFRKTWITWQKASELLAQQTLNI